LFIDLTLTNNPDGKIKHAIDLAHALDKIQTSLGRLRAKMTVANTTLCNHQILAYIEHAFTQVIPLPPPLSSDYRGELVYTSDLVARQKFCLGALYAVALEYVCCSKAMYKHDDVTIEITRVVTMASIMAVFDGILRIPSQLSKGWNTHHLSTVVANAFRPSTRSWLDPEEDQGKDGELFAALGFKPGTHTYVPNLASYVL
jgi:hypothetical protein